MRSPVPHIGNWYKEVTDNRIFEIVAYDNVQRTIAVQMLEGELDEFDLDSWAEMTLVAVEEPEDWRNALEADSLDGMATDLDDHAAPGYYDGLADNIETDVINGLWDD